MQNTKLKIGDKEFILNDYQEPKIEEGNSRPYISFDIDGNYAEVYPLTQIENQTYFIIFENGEQKDVSNKYLLFGFCKNDHNTKCQLVLEDYSAMEYKDMVINDFLEV